MSRKTDKAMVVLPDEGLSLSNRAVQVFGLADEGEQPDFHNQGSLLGYLEQKFPGYTVAAPSFALTAEGVAYAEKVLKEAQFQGAELLFAHIEEDKRKITVGAAFDEAKQNEALDMSNEGGKAPAHLQRGTALWTFPFSWRQHLQATVQGHRLKHEAVVGESTWNPDAIIGTQDQRLG